ncbi:MAG: hypothetical protein K2Y01_09370 [Rhabdochlamydiaceae bacterium]|nr:hypothetical protein [Rhabdochlamydiaceae bacterium]
MNIKSERLKKLESELGDLDQWLKLGLVPKKDLEKHKEEMKSLNEKIQEEKERLRFLKENGEMEEFNLPKRPTHGRPAFQEPHSLPDIDLGDEGMTDIDIDMESESFDLESSSGEDSSEGDEDSQVTEEEDEEDGFSERARFKRGIPENSDDDGW